MKFKNLLFASILLTTSVIGYGQDGDVADIRWGSTILLPKKHVSVGFTGSEKDGFMQYTEKTKKEYGFIRISSDLKSEGSKVVPFEASKYLMFERILEYDGRAFFLISDYDKEKESEILMVREVDLKRGGFLKKPETLIKTKGKVAGDYISTGMYSVSVTNKFKTVIPDKGNRILVYYRMKPTEKRDAKSYDKINFVLYDRDWKEIWKKDLTMPYTEANMNIYSVRLIGNEVFLFFTKKSGKLNPVTKKEEFDEIGVMHITQDSDKPKEYPFKLKEIEFDNFIIGKGFGESILIGGYTKPKKTSTVFNGYFTAVFNPKTFELESPTNFSFSKDLISAFESQRTKRKLDKQIAKGKEPGIPYLEVRQIIRREKGGWFFIGEQYHMYVTTSTSNGRTTYTYHYLFQDVIVSAVDANGKEQWVQKVPKNQHFTNTTYGAGIASFVYKDNVYVFYLDNVKNKDIEEGTAPIELRAAKGGCLMGVKITPKGELIRSMMLDNKEEKKLILPNNLDEVGDGVILSSSKNLGHHAKGTTPALINLN